MVQLQTYRWLAGLLLLVVYLVVRHISATMDGPTLTVSPPEARMPFVTEFALPDLEGTLVQWSALRGRPVLLNLWATWCSPCRIEMPSIQLLYQDYWARGFEVLAVALDTAGHTVVAPFVQQQQWTFPVLLDPQNMLGARLQVPGIPATYLLDKWGRIVSFAVGAHDWQTRSVRLLVEQLLTEDGAGPTP